MAGGGRFVNGLCCFALLLVDYHAMWSQASTSVCQKTLHCLLHCNSAVRL